MKHEQENMKELLKKKYLSPLIESYDMVGEIPLNQSPQTITGGDIGTDPDDKTKPGNGGRTEQGETKFRGTFYSPLGEDMDY